MFLFHTRLFINGLPVEYSVTKADEAFVFEAFFNPHDDLVAPRFSVKVEDENFIFKDLKDRDMIAQVEEILKEYFDSRLN